MPPPVCIAVEGPTDEVVAIRLLDETGLDVGAVYGKSGKPRLDARIGNWNRAAARTPWFVLRDLDRDADCAPTLVATLLPEPARLMCFRIAVRELEAWLLGDRERAARWLGVSRSLIPRSPESEDHPKQRLIHLARRSRNAEIRHDVVPPDTTTARVGRGYLAQVQRFARQSWRPAVAAKACPSLARCLAGLRKLRDASAG